MQAITDVPGADGQQRKLAEPSGCTSATSPFSMSLQHQAGMVESLPAISIILFAGKLAIIHAWSNAEKTV